jgi:hypothetical protein
MGTIEFSSRAEAQEAVRVLDESELDGRTISVREDRDMEDRGAAPERAERGFERAERGGGGDDSCYNCGGRGHSARDCPSEPSAGGGAGGRAPRARAPERERERPARGGATPGTGACNTCGQEGHWSRECPQAGGRAGGGGGRGGGGRGGRGGGRGGDRVKMVRASWVLCSVSAHALRLCSFRMRMS